MGGRWARTRRRCGALGLAAAIAAALAACAEIQIPQPTVRQVAAADRRIAFEAGPFAEGASRHVAFTDNWEREDYSLFRGGGVQAEMVYAAAVSSPVALDYPYWIERMVETWNHNRGREKAWGAEGRLRLRFGTVFYKPYRLVAERRECVGFSGEWDYPPDDPEKRPGQVLFGYYCAAPGAALDTPAIEALLREVALVDPFYRPKQGRLEVAAEAQAAAVSLARGAAGPDGTGHPGFPFRFARVYRDVDGPGRIP